MNAAKHYTRKQLVDFLRGAGYPVTMHAMNKYCSPARNEGPPVIAYWGRLPLYDPADALQWAEARLRPVSTQATAVAGREMTAA
jgi:hypothetical protein